MFQLRGLGGLFGGTKPTNPPVATGLSRPWTKVE